MASSACCVLALVHGSAYCPTHKEAMSMRNCDQVELGDLCQGDGECDTNNGLNNCQTFDIYTRVACEATVVPAPSPPIPEPSPPCPSPLPSPPLPSLPPSPPPPDCPGTMTYNHCGAACNSTCSEPNPYCPMVCTPRCECPLETPIWHEDLQACGTTDQCQGLVISAANTPHFMTDPCAAYLHVNDESTTNQTRFFHTGQPKLAMFTTDHKACCEACNNLNIVSPSSPPAAPPPPRAPPDTLSYLFPGVVDNSQKACHAIAVYRHQFGTSCRFFDRQRNGAQGVLVIVSPGTAAESSNYQTSTEWFVADAPSPSPPPSQPPPSPVPPPPFGPPSAGATIDVYTECPKTVPSAGDDCSNYTITSDCLYGLVCCADGTCTNTTNATCEADGWWVVSSQVVCANSTMQHPPPPPSEGLDPALLIGIAAAGASALVLVSAGVYAFFVRGAASAPEVGATKPLLVQTSRSAPATRASLPPWTFHSLSVSRR